MNLALFGVLFGGGRTSITINEVQTSTERAVDIIKEIASIGDELDEVTATIAAAIEDQGAATQEISATTAMASNSTDSLATGISEVSGAISKTGDAAEIANSTSRALTEQSEARADAVKEFFMELRTGTFDRRVADDPNYMGPERRLNDVQKAKPIIRKAA